MNNPLGISSILRNVSNSDIEIEDEDILAALTNHEEFKVIDKPTDKIEAEALSIKAKGTTLGKMAEVGKSFGRLLAGVAGYSLYGASFILGATFSAIICAPGAIVGGAFAGVGAGIGALVYAASDDDFDLNNDNNINTFMKRGAEIGFQVGFYGPAAPLALLELTASIYKSLIVYSFGYLGSALIAISKQEGAEKREELIDLLEKVSMPIVYHIRDSYESFQANRAKSAAVDEEGFKAVTYADVLIPNPDLDSESVTDIDNAFLTIDPDRNKNLSIKSSKIKEELAELRDKSIKINDYFSEQFKSLTDEEQQDILNDIKNISNEISLLEKELEIVSKHLDNNYIEEI